ncbi:class IIb bacteriocin, lactobin A/cerein 7B family [Clostridium sp. HCP1S3_B4]|uniref:class IIb bacteriocin, lactobin A/cerein 7B family n=1 Tax=unclassified Clostridium TaxID=2614128 RepID=UPI003F8CCB04
MIKLDNYELSQVNGGICWKGVLGCGATAGFAIAALACGPATAGAALGYIALYNMGVIGTCVSLAN